MDARKCRNDIVIWVMPEFLGMLLRDQSVLVLVIKAEYTLKAPSPFGGKEYLGVILNFWQLSGKSLKFFLGNIFGSVFHYLLSKAEIAQVTQLDARKDQNPQLSIYQLGTFNQSIHLVLSSATPSPLHTQGNVCLLMISYQKHCCNFSWLRESSDSLLNYGKEQKMLPFI